MKTNLHGEASGVCFICCQIEINIQLPLETTVRDSQESVWAHIESQIAWGTTAINLCSDKPHHSWNLQPRWTQPPPPRSASLEESISIDTRSSHVLPIPPLESCAQHHLQSSPLLEEKGDASLCRKCLYRGKYFYTCMYNMKQTLDKISGTIKDSLAKI